MTMILQTRFGAQTPPPHTPNVFLASQSGLTFGSQQLAATAVSFSGRGPLSRKRTKNAMSLWVQPTPPLSERLAGVLTNLGFPKWSRSNMLRDAHAQIFSLRAERDGARQQEQELAFQLLLNSQPDLRQTWSDLLSKEPKRPGSFEQSATPEEWESYRSEEKEFLDRQEKLKANALKQVTREDLLNLALRMENQIGGQLYMQGQMEADMAHRGAKILGQITAAFRKSGNNSRAFHRNGSVAALQTVINRPTPQEINDRNEMTAAKFQHELKALRQNNPEAAQEIERRILGQMSNPSLPIGAINLLTQSIPTSNTDLLTANFQYLLRHIQEERIKAADGLREGLNRWLQRFSNHL
ncbi:MAG: hypothetical protein VKK59_06050 [Vampirovibrionales bacterium]|nr:hypothetical protein [Vampirovibrionales bacterium]